jgi:hypothetical protein
MIIELTQDDTPKSWEEKFCMAFNATDPDFRRDLGSICQGLYSFYRVCSFDFVPGSLKLDNLAKYGELGQIVIKDLKEKFKAGFVKDEIDRYEASHSH